MRGGERGDRRAQGKAGKGNTVVRRRARKLVAPDERVKTGEKNKG